MIFQLGTLLLYFMTIHQKLMLKLLSTTSAHVSFLAIPLFWTSCVKIARKLYLSSVCKALSAYEAVIISLFWPSTLTKTDIR